MNISMNNTIQQMSFKSLAYSNVFDSKVSENKGSSTDKMEISSEGKVMSRMLRNDQAKEQREAHKIAFQETYSALAIDSLNTDDMTDEEIKEVLTAFEENMSEHMQDSYKPGSEMTSSELKSTVNDLQGLNDKMDKPKGQYGPPPVGGKGPKPIKGGETTSINMLEALETDDEDEEDIISTLLEALETEDSTSFYVRQTMEEMVSMLGVSSEALSL